ncbi:MFS transporter [Zooshikella sp. RANM57]|uniref:MFS transporter n=1 Tax=Zooshikella sp. RANM57 TaxID=3425863 RepID=UPI003D6ED4D1
MVISPLSDSRYRHLFSAQVIALFGTGLTTVALALLAHDLAGGEAGKVLGFALALKMVAYVVISPFISAFIQHLPRRTVLVLLDVLRAAVVLVLPWVTEVWQIYLLVFLLNVFSAGFTPVFQATIPDIIKNKDQYTKALSLSRLAYDLENLLSPMAAAALIALMNFNMLFLLNTAAFLISAALVVTVILPNKAQHSGDVSFWVRASQGIKIYLKTPRLRGLLVLCMVVAAAGAMQIVNTVVYVRTELGLGESWVALAFAAVGGGSMLAAFSIPFILRKLTERHTMLIGGGIISISVLLGLMQPEVSMLLVLWWLIGVGTSMILTPVGQLLTHSCQEVDRPAVFAAQFSLSHACWLIAYPLAGWLGAQFGMPTAFGVLGLIALFSVTMAALIWPTHDQYKLEHTHEALQHNHWHIHDEHHQHEHEGWEGPEPHSHPHRHTALKHVHPFVIDDHHPRWP